LPGGGVREVCEDQHGRIWAGTTRGLSLYHPEADPDPPRTYVQPLTAKEKNIPAGGTITLTFSGEDKGNTPPASGCSTPAAWTRAIGPPHHQSPLRPARHRSGPLDGL
jgi:hypothetical protein